MTAKLDEATLVHVLLGFAIGLPVGVLIGMQLRGSGTLFERNKDGNITAILPVPVKV